mgnify:CR=1 FL=1
MSEISVFSSPFEPMADMAVELLMDACIPARKSIACRELCPWIGNNYGTIDVLVPERYAMTAMELLSVRFSGNGEIKDEDLMNGKPDDNDTIN